MALDLAKFRQQVEQAARSAIGSNIRDHVRLLCVPEFLLELITLAERAQAYETALREIVEIHDSNARDMNFKRCGCKSCAPARKALEV